MMSNQPVVQEDNDVADPSRLHNEEEEEEQEEEEEEEEVEEENDQERQRRLQQWQSAPQQELGRMELTADEHRLAVAIKKAVEEETPEDGEKVKLSDFQYAQLALVCGAGTAGTGAAASNESQCIEAAKERVYGQQAFLQYYEIEDSLDQGMQIMGEYITKLQPGHLLNCEFFKRDETYVLVADNGKFLVDRIQQQDGKHRNKRIWLGNLYYILHSMNPDLASTRKGISCAIDFDGFDWKKNIDLATFKIFYTELLFWYPTNYHKMKYFNTNWFVNMCASLTKRIAPPKYQATVEMGCTVPAGRLASFYDAVHPNHDQRLLQSLEKALILRYQNESTFSL